MLHVLGEALDRVALGASNIAQNASFISKLLAPASSLTKTIQVAVAAKGREKAIHGYLV
jgi:hypothetical protein